MGLHKKLKALADNKDMDAQIFLAEDARARGNLHQALLWFSRAGKDNEVLDIKKRMSVSYDEDDW